MAYTTLISAQTLINQLADCQIIDCRFSLADTQLGEKLFAQGHIPGARYAHLDRDLSSTITPFSGRHPLPDFKDLATKLGQWGITEQTQVVVYDDTSGFFASRLWWLIRTLGHDHVAVLDGGVQAWQDAGQALNQTSLPHSPASFNPTPDQSAWIDVAGVQQGLNQHSCVLIDARARERFDGIEEPIDPIAGHIPGSVNLPSTDNLDHQGKFLPAKTIRENYLSVMSDFSPEQVIHSCGSGVFACFGVLAMEYAGLPGSKIYPGSWSEWIRDPSRPIGTSR